MAATPLQGLPPLEEELDVPKPPCETQPVSAVPLAGVGSFVWATGFRLNFEALVELPDLADETGYPKARRGVSDVAPGLYFLGLPWLYSARRTTRTSVAIQCVQHHESFSLG